MNVSGVGLVECSVKPHVVLICVYAVGCYTQITRISGHTVQVCYCLLLRPPVGPMCIPPHVFSLLYRGVSRLLGLIVSHMT